MEEDGAACRADSLEPDGVVPGYGRGESLHRGLPRWIRYRWGWERRDFREVKREEAPTKIRIDLPDHSAEGRDRRRDLDLHPGRSHGPERRRLGVHVEPARRRDAIRIRPFFEGRPGGEVRRKVRHEIPPLKPSGLAGIGFGVDYLA